LRHTLTKVLRQRVTRELRRALPHFRERKTRSGVRGTTLYEWRATRALTCYVALVVDEERDRFTVELAWSLSGHFPAQVRHDSPDEAPRGGAMRFHLRALWQRYRVEPSWSLTPKTPDELTLDRTLIDPDVPDGKKAALLEARDRRIATVLGEPGGDPGATLRPEEEPATDALSRIGPAVDDVVARLQRYAAPYFARAVAEHGDADPGALPLRSRVAGPV
jgi:hypothetical protein